MKRCRSKRNCWNRSCQGHWHFVRTVSCFQHFSTKNIKGQFKQVTRWETKTTPRCTKMIQDVYDTGCFFWNIFIPFWDWFIVFQCLFRLFDIILACGKSFVFWPTCTRLKMDDTAFSLSWKINWCFIRVQSSFCEVFGDWTRDFRNGFFSGGGSLWRPGMIPSFCPAMGHVGLWCLMYCSDQACAWPLSMSNHSRRREFSFFFRNSLWAYFTPHWVSRRLLFNGQLIENRHEIRIETFAVSTDNRI